MPIDKCFIDDKQAFVSLVNGLTKTYQAKDFRLFDSFMTIQDGATVQEIMAFSVPMEMPCLT